MQNKQRKARHSFFFNIRQMALSVPRGFLAQWFLILSNMGIGLQGGPKNGASVFYCEYFENPTKELRESWTSAVLYVERSNYLFV